MSKQIKNSTQPPIVCDFEFVMKTKDGAAKPSQIVSYLI